MNHLSNNQQDSLTITSGVRKFCGQHELLGHERRQTSGRHTPKHHAYTSSSHVDPSESRVTNTPSPPRWPHYPGSDSVVLALILHLLLGAKCGQCVVVVGQISSTAANAASAAAALLVARGLEPTPSAFGLQRYSLSFEPMASHKAGTVAPEVSLTIKTDKMGGSGPTPEPATRRNFGDRLTAGSLLGQVIGKLAPSNLTTPKPPQIPAKGKRDLITRMLKYRLPRANPLLSSWIRVGSNLSTITGAHNGTDNLFEGHPIGTLPNLVIEPPGDSATEQVLDSQPDVQLVVNASTRDYQVVRLVEPSSSTLEKQRSWHYPRITDRVSGASDSDTDIQSAQDKWAENKGFWKTEGSGQEESRSQAQRDSRNAQDRFKDGGHLRHGWKNVFHREELKDQQRYHDVAQSKNWPVLSNSTKPKFNVSRAGSGDKKWLKDNDSYGSKYDYVKGNDWRQQEPDELEPDEEPEPMPKGYSKRGQRYELPSSTPNQS